MGFGSPSCPQGPNIMQQRLRGAGPCTGVTAGLAGVGTRGRRGTWVGWGNMSWDLRWGWEDSGLERPLRLAECPAPLWVQRSHGSFSNRRVAWRLLTYKQPWWGASELPPQTSLSGNSGNPSPGQCEEMLCPRPGASCIVPASSEPLDQNRQKSGTFEEPHGAEETRVPESDSRSEVGGSSWGSDDALLVQGAEPLQVPDRMLDRIPPAARGGSGGGEPRLRVAATVQVRVAGGSARGGQWAGRRWSDTGHT